MTDPPPPTPRRTKSLRSLLIVLLVACCVPIAAVWWRRHADELQPSLQPPAIHSSNRPADDLSGIARDLRIKAWHPLDELPHDLAQFETVFWEPRDTDSLRSWLASYPPLSGARVLEIGTGTGFIALWCLQHGAQKVVATDINPQAVANARYNAELMGWSQKIDVRLVSAAHPGPFAIIDSSERFDLIISNPPWEDAAVTEVAAYALYDPGFQLLDGLMRDGDRFLQPDGKLLLAYGAQAPIQRIMSTAPSLGWQVTVRDERELAQLPKVFVPGVLLELQRR